MTKKKLNRKDKKSLDKLNAYITQRSKLLITSNAVQAATLERINRMQELANQMEVDDSPAMSLCGHKLYAWEFQDIAKELRFLFNEMKN